MDCFQIYGFVLDDDLFIVEVFPLYRDTDEEQLETDIAMQRLEDVD